MSCSLFRVVWFCCYIVFIEEPHSVNASEGSIASFTCTRGANTIRQQWLVDYKSLNNVNNVYRGIQTFDNGTSYLMTMPATAKNDGVIVRCMVTKGKLTYPSQLAVLRVQGLYTLQHDVCIYMYVLQHAIAD